jgi:hypothetical protein
LAPKGCGRCKRRIARARLIAYKGENPGASDRSNPGFAKVKNGDPVARDHGAPTSARNSDGSLMYPGEWMETYALLPGAGVWMMLSFRPAEEPLQFDAEVQFPAP